MYKKILSLLLISLLVISSFGMCSAMTLKFENGGNGTDYGNIIYLTDQKGNVLWEGLQETQHACDKKFDIPNNIIQKSYYLNVTGIGYIRWKPHTIVTHHITLSDDFKQKIPHDITFHLGWAKTYLYLNFANHHCEANTCTSNSISWTFKRWD